MVNWKQEEWVIIGISGVTCGGKTTLANKLKDTLVPIYIFNQDKYFYPDDSPHHVKVSGLETEHNNYDILSSLDMEAMHQDIVMTLQGNNKAHAYSLDRTKNKIEIVGKKFLIMEGFTVLNYRPLLEMCDMRYYLVLEYGECAARRCLRLYSPPDIEGYFEQCVWPEHLRYRAQIEKDKRVKLLDGARHDALEIVLSDLEQIGAQSVTS